METFVRLYRQQSILLSVCACPLFYHFIAPLSPSPHLPACHSFLLSFLLSISFSPSFSFLLLSSQFEFVFLFSHSGNTLLLYVCIILLFLTDDGRCWSEILSRLLLYRHMMNSKPVWIL